MAKTTASASGTNRYRATPLRKEHRQEHDADAERGNQRGHGDLRGAFQDGVVEIVPFLEIALDVFDGDGRVVHQDADRQRQSARAS